MELTAEGVNLIKKYEGISLKAYKCPAGVWTIGHGNTEYENGASVKPGDVITLEGADELFKNTLLKFSNRLKNMIKQPLNKNQFSALVSFSYNVGTSALSNSTLLKKINANPHDPTIAKEFMRWTRAGGKELMGLKLRREAESKLYFSK